MRLPQVAVLGSDVCVDGFADDQVAFDLESLVIFFVKGIICLCAEFRVDESRTHILEQFEEPGNEVLKNVTQLTSLRNVYTTLAARRVVSARLVVTDIASAQLSVFIGRPR